MVWAINMDHIPEWLASAICSNFSWSRFSVPCSAEEVDNQVWNLSCSMKSSATASIIAEKSGVAMKVAIVFLTSWGVLRVWKKVCSAKTVNAEWTWEADLIKIFDDVNQCQPGVVFEVQKAVVPGNCKLWSAHMGDTNTENDWPSW